uniref:ornithine decarboxylase n=1 Tax=Oryza punctata TaxID=4537 RepID=A0A0E0JZV2_ORYPU
MAGAEGDHMEVAVLAAPVVKDREVLRFRRDVTGLVRTIVVASAPDTRATAAGAFNVLELGEVARLFAAWRRGLRGCNPNPALLGALAGLGAGFDCASRVEMEAVLALGVEADRVVYANPCKLESHLEYAASVGVDLTTFDSEEEVGKIKRCHPRCRLLLRIKAPDGDAKANLGTKYGAHREEVVPLLVAARRAGMPVVGVSFHVGSAMSRVGIYAGAIEVAREAFDAAAALGMQPMHVLDIGGGFKAGDGDKSTFMEASTVINAALARHFGDDMPGVEVIAEPGRYFAETAFALAARIFGKRTRGEVREYWIDDGMFGTLCCVHFENYVPRPAPVTAIRRATADGEQAATMGGEITAKTHPSTVFGPTLDSFDVMVRGYQLPELCTGDWLVFDDVGAYTTVCSSDFNGFSTSNMETYLAYSY